MCTPLVNLFADGGDWEVIHPGRSMNLCAQREKRAY